PPRFSGLIWTKRVSQKRSTCCGRSSCSATSLKVRKASGLLSMGCRPPRASIRPPSERHKTADSSHRPPPEETGRGNPRAGVRRLFLVPGPCRLMGAQDALLQHVRCLEGHDPARQDRHFLAGLGIAPDPLVLVADLEGGEGRQLHGLAAD